MSDALPPPTGSPIQPAAQTKTPRIIVWAFILSLFGVLVVTAIASIVMAVLGLNKAKEVGKGKGLAIAAIAISGFWLAIIGIGSLLPGTEVEQSTTTETVSEEAPAEVPVDPGLVTREEFGAEWPFTVDEGIVRCETNGLDAAIVNLAGVDYALNGVAQTQGYAALNLDSDVWLDTDFGTKVSIGPIIRRALDLCGEQSVASQDSSEAATSEDIAAQFASLGSTIDEVPARWNEAVAAYGIGLPLPNSISSTDDRFNIAEGAASVGPNRIALNWNAETKELLGVEIIGPHGIDGNAAQIIGSAAAMVYATTDRSLAESEAFIIEQLVGDSLETAELGANSIATEVEEPDRWYRFFLDSSNVIFSVDSMKLN